MTYYVTETAYPAKSVVFIKATWGNTTYTGTGFLVGRNDLLTAAHVVYDPKLGRIADTIKIYPVYNPDKSNQNFYSYSAMDFYNNSNPGAFDPDRDGLISAGDNRFSTMGHAEVDIALLSLSKPLGDTYGYFGVDPDYNNGGNVSVIGFPGAYDNYAVRDEGSVYADATDQVYINNGNVEINPGNSGGPIFYDTANGPYAVGLVSTKSYFTDIGGHWSWLKETMKDNDRFIEGYSGHTVNGTSGNDVFGLFAGKGRYTSVGNDTVYGGAGRDTVKYQGPGSDFTFTRNGTTITVTDKTGSEGRDTLYDVERLTFDNGTLAFDFSGSAGQTYRLYQAAFARTPDRPGLSHNVNLVDQGMTLKQMAGAFIGSAEFIQRYGVGTSNTTYLTALYQNVLGRGPDQAGLNGWLDRLANGTWDRQDVLLGFSESPENQSLVGTQIANGIWLL